ncbi:hypothetical protein [Halovivax gelatinilyticus]|uniref:hypothetical protein n=1 Tax=Halovivax gelatinilyticus TaxID=2961597 RepID=UPI0020CA7222|nr:hypothetical protein [Halovivax gelatinilyticus]
MDPRKRVGIAAIWFVVAALVGVTMAVEDLSRTAIAVRVVAIGLAVFLGFVYLLDPWGVASRDLFEPSE